ncbi:MAG: hypothetical protein CVU52_02000 [Deltaproteobacteria bacterium HGW-Deltaproteobacteria-10]|nr:MAG: hypothetical protein CVU52_02000 [Deltaproteobacteria bacterium HGW-Deltaproteobacteria-10]
MTNVNPEAGTNPKPLRVLMVEDSESAALMIIRSLNQGGFAPAYLRVETAQDMSNALREQSWDIILCDYSMPLFSGPAAITLLKSTNIDIPLIVVSGTIGEETAVECMKLGAHDYVMKNNLARLVPVIERELAETQSRRERRLAEEAFIANEFRFEELFHNMSNCAAVYEALGNATDFIFKDLNRAAEKTEKIDRKNVIGKSVMEIFPGAGEMGLLEALERVWKTGKAEQMPPAFYRDNRTAGWRVNYVYKLPTGEVVTLYNDITERINAERKLFESEEKYRLVVENSSEAILIAQDGMFKFVNKAALKLFGAPYEVIISKPFTDFIHPDDREIVLSSHWKRQSGEAVPDSYEFRVLTAAGTVRWVVIRATLIPWEGKPATLNFLADFTERRLAENRLRESEERYRSLYVDSRDAIMVLLPGHGFIAGNPAAIKIFGCLDQQDFLNQTPDSLSPEFQPDGMASADKAQEMIRLALENGSHSFEWLHRKMDGTDFPATVLLSRLEKSGTNLLQATVRDITASKQAEEKLALDLEMKSAMSELLSLSLKDETVMEYLDSALDVVLSLKWLAIESKGAIFLADAAEETLHLQAHRGLSKEIYSLCKTVPFGHCMCGRAAALMASQFADQVDERHDITYEGMPPHGHYCLPIKSGNHILGVLNLYVKEGHIRSAWEEDFLNTVTKSLAITVERKQAEKALLENEKKYRDLYDFLPIPVYEMDFEANIISANRAIYETFRGTEEDLQKGFKGWQLLSPEDIEKSKKNIASLLRGEKITGTEYNMMRLDGSVFPAIVISSLIYTDGKPTGLRGAVIDVTQRKQAEEAIRQSAEKYRNIYESAREGIFQSTPNGRYVSVNPAFARMFGYVSPEEMMDQITSIGSQLYVNSTDRENIRAALAQTGYVNEFEAQMRRKDGTTFWTSMNAHAVCDEKGDLLYIEGTNVDITERKLTEEKIRHISAIQTLILDNTSMGIAFARNRMLEWVNQRLGEMILLPLDKLQGASTRIIYPSDESYEELGRTAYPILARGERSETILQLRRSDGTLFWCRFMGKALNPAKPQDGSIWMLEDITERKQAEEEILGKNQQLEEAYEELRQKQAMVIQQEKMASIGMLASGIAHEIKNPLAIVLQGINYLQTTVKDDALMTEVVGRMNTAVLRADVIVKGLLSYARQEVLTLVEQDIPALIDESLILAEHEFRKKNLRLIKQYAPDLPKTSVDGGQIKQVFINLLMNGSDAMSPGGTFTISVRSIEVGNGKKLLEISFQDTGHGIPDDKLNNIFDPFYTTKTIGNTGLGLSISKGIIDSHGGIIYAENRKEQGAIFVILLPVQ